MHRGLFRTAAYVLACVALALAGSVVALRAASPESRSVTLGTVAVDVVPARSGEVDVYVPVVDWGVRAEPYTAPVAVELEFRSLDRDAALAALRSGGSADASLDGARGRAARCGLGRPQASGVARAPRRRGRRPSRRTRSSPSSTAAAGSCSGLPPGSRPRSRSSSSWARASTGSTTAPCASRPSTPTARSCRGCSSSRSACWPPARATTTPTATPSRGSHG